MDALQLRSKPTGELLSHALGEIQLLIKAELLHAKHELGEQLGTLKSGAISFGLATVTGICAVAVVVTALIPFIPLPAPWGALLTAGILLIVCVASVLFGIRALPKTFLQKTQERVKQDLASIRSEVK